jgi:hypothetical protein
MNHHLTPPVDMRIRVAALVVLLIPVFLAPRLSLVWRALACFMPLVLTGTFRTSKIDGDWFDTRFFLGYVPVIHHRCKLRGVIYIGTKYGESGTGWGTFMLFGPVQWIFGLIFDFLVPAIGGPYELWVETAKGREIVAWQGYSQHHFQKNLELLCNQTGAEIRSR